MEKLPNENSKYKNIFILYIAIFGVPLFLTWLTLNSSLYRFLPIEIKRAWTYVNSRYPSEGKVEFLLKKDPETKVLMANLGNLQSWDFEKYFLSSSASIDINKIIYPEYIKKSNPGERVFFLSRYYSTLFDTIYLALDSDNEFVKYQLLEFFYDYSDYFGKNRKFKEQYLKLDKILATWIKDNYKMLGKIDWATARLDMILNDQFDILSPIVFKLDDKILLKLSKNLEFKLGQHVLSYLQSEKFLLEDNTNEKIMKFAGIVQTLQPISAEILITLVAASKDQYGLVKNWTNEDYKERELQTRIRKYFDSYPSVSKKILQKLAPYTSNNKGMLHLLGTFLNDDRIKLVAKDKSFGSSFLNQTAASSLLNLSLGLYDHKLLTVEAMFDGFGFFPDSPSKESIVKFKYNWPDTSYLSDLLIDKKPKDLNKILGVLEKNIFDPSNYQSRLLAVFGFKSLIGVKSQKAQKIAEKYIDQQYKLLKNKKSSSDFNSEGVLSANIMLIKNDRNLAKKMIFKHIATKETYSYSGDMYFDTLTSAYEYYLKAKYPDLTFEVIKKSLLNDYDFKTTKSLIGKLRSLTDYQPAQKWLMTLAGSDNKWCAKQFHIYFQTDERRWGESQPSYFCPDMKQEAISTLSFSQSIDFLKSFYLDNNKDFSEDNTKNFLIKIGTHKNKQGINFVKKELKKDYLSPSLIWDISEELNLKQRF